MQYCFACSNLLTQSAKCTLAYSAGAKGVRKSIAPITLVACSVIFLRTSSPVAAGWSKAQGLVAFVVTATFCISSSISS